MLKKILDTWLVRTSFMLISNSFIIFSSSLVCVFRIRVDPFFAVIADLGQDHETHVALYLCIAVYTLVHFMSRKKYYYLIQAATLRA